MCIAEAKFMVCVQLLIVARTLFLINKDFSPSDILKIAQTVPSSCRFHTREGLQEITI